MIRLRANTAESWYHSLQTSLDKRFSDGLSAGVHYTWSQFDDTASEVFNPSSGEVAVAQDSFDLDGRQGPRRRTTGRTASPATSCGSCRGCATSRAWSARSSAAGRSARSSRFQSGAPFTVLNGSDPTGALAGIDGLVGNAIRPMLNTDRDLSRHDGRGAASPPAARACSGRCAATRAPTCAGERVGNVAAQLAARRRHRQRRHRVHRRTRASPNGHNIQLRIEMFNATNTRNFGIPEGRINSTNFLNQWGTDGGNRRNLGRVAICVLSSQ